VVQKSIIKCGYPFIFDFLYKRKDEIESAFGAPLHWMRLDDKKMSRIQFTSQADGYNRDRWSDHIEWHLAQMTRFEKALKQPLLKAAEALKKSPVN
jgi:hypothetical protein